MVAGVLLIYRMKWTVATGRRAFDAQIEMRRLQSGQQSRRVGAEGPLIGCHRDKAPTSAHPTSHLISPMYR
jgi:hypothetical protein